MVYTVSTGTKNTPMTGGNLTIGRKKGGSQSSGEDKSGKIQEVTQHLWKTFTVTENKHVGTRYITSKSMKILLFWFNQQYKLRLSVCVVKLLQRHTLIHLFIWEINYYNINVPL